MTRLVPHPLLSAVLVLMWLLLTQFSLGQLILGVFVALVAGWAFGSLEPNPVRIRRFGPLVRLMAYVSVDILRSNLAVAWLIASNGRDGQRRSGFVEIPLRMRSPEPLALLAIVITATPGTAWLKHDMETGVLLLHVFDLVDEEDWHRLVRDRYEALLMEAFG